LTEEELPECLFETRHGMNPEPAELERARTCPRCQGTDTIKTYDGYNLHAYVRGYGYLDKAGCHRDMNVYKLEHEDPYARADSLAGLRAPGEVDDLKHRLKKAGRHQPNTITIPVTPTS
jgi:hypothetical protein